jgi:hypothetical protein
VAAGVVCRRDDGTHQPPVGVHHWCAIARRVGGGVEVTGRAGMGWHRGVRRTTWPASQRRVSRTGRRVCQTRALGHASVADAGKALQNC